VEAFGHSCGNDLAVGPDLDKRRVDLLEPAECVEGHEASLAYHHETLEARRRPIEAVSLSLPPDPLVND
jgi:hypothetical protein